MSEPYWEPLGAMPAANYSLPLRLEAAGITAGNRPDANACTENGYYVVYTAGTPASANLPPGVNQLIFIRWRMMRVICPNLSLFVW